ncbi:MAG: leucine-rich repeat domain-containing protein, partial [Clostridium sp.]
LPEFKSLERLNISGNTSIKDISPLKNCSKLKDLWLTGDSIVDYTPLKDKDMNVQFMDSHTYLPEKIVEEGNKIILSHLPKLTDKDGKVFTVQNTTISINGMEFNSEITNGDSILIDKSLFEDSYVDINVTYSLSVGSVVYSYRVPINIKDLSLVSQLKNDSINTIPNKTVTAAKKYLSFSDSQMTQIQNETGNNANYKLFRAVYDLCFSMYAYGGNNTDELKGLVNTLKNLDSVVVFKSTELTFINDILKYYVMYYGSKNITSDDLENINAIKEFIAVSDKITGNNKTVLYQSLKNNILKVIENAKIKEDINSDCKIDIADLALFSDKYNLKTGDNGYEEKYDLNNDSIIDLLDIVTVSNKIK